jgi:2',3'-cyclic-nucleotide 2'-phosphodiesterase (5'-nucleotidase family)
MTQDVIILSTNLDTKTVPLKLKVPFFFTIQVPVVQAYCYSKYLGHFELYFDERGELKTPVDGIGVQNASPILLDKTIQEEPLVLEKIKEYRPKITEFTRLVGETLTKLKRNQQYESNLGNAIADAFIQVLSKKIQSSLS